MFMCCIINAYVINLQSQCNLKFIKNYDPRRIPRPFCNDLSTMKDELLKEMHFCTIARVRKAVLKAVEFYNNEHPHMSVDMMTPMEAARCSGEISKRWKSYTFTYH